MIDPTNAPRLRTAVIGVGRVGSVLGAAFDRAGHQVVAVSAISAESIGRAKRLLPQAKILPPHEAIASADLVLLTVPDDELSALIVGLANAGAWRAGQLAVHTSGVHGIGAFAAAAAQGVVGIALHPVMTFAGRPEDLLRLDGTPFGVTAPEEFRPAAELLVLQLGGDPVWIAEQARSKYHAALSIGSNYLVTVVADSLSILASAGVDEPARLIAPLLSATLDNALRLGDNALTGPVQRADVTTVQAHIRALAGSEYVDSYLAMAIRTMQRAQAAGRLTSQQCDDLIEGIRIAQEESE